jgi:hypothetical protein
MAFLHAKGATARSVVLANADGTNQRTLFTAQPPLFLVDGTRVGSPACRRRPIVPRSWWSVTLYLLTKDNQ